jgi:hypothetical protein
MTTMTDSFHERGKALEDMFFHNRDQQLLDQMKADMHGKEAREAIVAATGIEDPEVVDRLLETGISKETLASLSLVPLVMVAWADGTVEPSERAAIMTAADQNGLTKDSAAYGLLQNWLANKPDPELLHTWEKYVAALKKSITEEDFAHLHVKVIGRAKLVAESAGGFLGLNKTSANEQRVIDKLESAFH